MPLHVDVTEGGTLLRLTIDEPKGNVLTGETMQHLSTALAQYANHAPLRLVVLTAAGPDFSFGASIAEHRKDKAPTMLHAFHALARQLARYPVPTAALVRGRCFGGAFELVACCSFVFSTPGARFACPEVKLGVFPPVLAAIGAQRLGIPLRDRLILTGDDLDAETAHGVGFVNQLMAGDAFTTLLEWYRVKLRPLSAHALRTARRACLDATEDVLGATLDRLERRYFVDVLESHDGNEGIEAYLEKRAPQWTDA